MDSTRDPAGNDTRASEPAAPETELAQESLIDEVSIDGMCGVY